MAATSPYPDNDRSEWVVVPMDTPRRDSAGLLCWSYKVYASLASQQGGDEPFLYNSHKATIRANHQRMAEAPDGRLRHISGELVAKEDVEDFLANEAAAYRWVDRWTDDGGRTLAPFQFQTYQGETEELDPQWERDQYAVSEDSQRIAVQNNYLDSVHTRRLSGDRRGTTLTIQVAASSDDMRAHSGSTINLDNAGSPSWLHSSVTMGWGCRFLNVTIPVDSTIDVAHMIWTASSNSADPSRTVTIYGEDVDDSVTFTSYANYNSRTRTSATGSYTLPEQALNDEYNTVSLVGVIQEIIDRGGWASGNDISLLQNQEAAHAGDLAPEAHSYDSDTAKAAKLYIEYTAPRGPLRPVMFI